MKKRLKQVAFLLGVALVAGVLLFVVNGTLLSSGESGNMGSLWARSIVRPAKMPGQSR